MKPREAGREHLIAGAALVILSLVIVILLISTGGKGIGVWSAWGLAIYFFGVWGGVEIGR